jgi:hypothetical protein
MRTAYFWLFSAREFNRDSRASKAIWILGYQRSLTTFLKPALLHADGRPMLTGIYAASGHIPGVRFAAITHPGLNGTAPSAELLATWNKREGELIVAHRTLFLRLLSHLNPLVLRIWSLLSIALFQVVLNHVSEVPLHTSWQH